MRTTLSEAQEQLRTPRTLGEAATHRADQRAKGDGRFWIAPIVAMLVSAAAGAKAYGLAVGEPRSLLVGCTVVMESALALWLASSFAPRWAWRVSLACFGIFILVALWAALHGAKSCGCFGAVPVRPWATVSVDTAVLIALGIYRPASARPLSSPAIWGRGIVLLIIGWTLGALAAHYAGAASQLSAALPITTSTAPADKPILAVQISATTWLADLGDVQAQRTYTILFHLHSPLANDVQIRGVNATCSCMSLPKPPATVTATGTTPAEVIYRVPPMEGSYDQSILLTTDAPQLPPLKLQVKARVHKSTN